MLCDTNVLIRHFQNDPITVGEMVKIGSDNAILPSIVVMELFRGMANKNELAQMKSKLKHYNILHIDKPVSEKALEFIENYRLSHDLRLPDVLIGAMAAVYQIPLFTYNVKDFKYLPDLEFYQSAT